MTFRDEAREALERGRTELASSEVDRLRYAALELRMAMEALTYDRAQAFKEDVPPEEYATWQPRKVLEMLLEIDPNADKDVGLAVGIEEEFGQPAKDMQFLGSEKVLSLAVLKEHYDALGSYLHMPTVKQIREGRSSDLDRLRSRCETVVKALEGALASPIFNVTLGNIASSTCIRCNEPVRRRMPQGSERLEAACFECGAQYLVYDEGGGRALWKPRQEQVVCPECRTSQWIWLDHIRVGASFSCVEYGKKIAIVLGLRVSSQEE